MKASFYFALVAAAPLAIILCARPAGASDLAFPSLETTSAHHSPSLLKRQRGGRRAAAAAAKAKAAAATATQPAKAAAATQVAATGGKGGIDAATGQKLFALPAESDFCKSVKAKPADGTQIKTGDCSSLPQGQIPTIDNMVSSIITKPKNGDNIGVGAGFTVSVKTRGLQTGFFTEAATEYYTQPQTINAQGQVRGHQHITIQNLGSEDSPPDPQAKDFFKGLNDKADGQGTLSVDVPKDTLKTAGTYRICSMSGSFSHQPLVMPVAQRGSQDDCIRITVGGKGGAAKSAAATQAATEDAGGDDDAGGAAKKPAAAAAAKPKPKPKARPGRGRGRKPRGPGRK